MSWSGPLPHACGPFFFGDSETKLAGGFKEEHTRRQQVYVIGTTFTESSLPEATETPPLRR